MIIAPNTKRWMHTELMVIFRMTPTISADSAGRFHMTKNDIKNGKNKMILTHFQVGFLVISGCAACAASIIRGLFFPPNQKKVKKNEEAAT